MSIKETMSKLSTKNIYGVSFLIMCFVMDLIYLSNTSANIPTMDYWRFGQNFLYDIFNGGIRFNDFWESTNGQRAFLTYALFYLNIKFFHWNARVSMYLGAIFTLITGILIIGIVDRFEFSEEKNRDNFIRQIFIMIMALILFNNIQWEIKNTEFYAPFSVCSFFCILNFWLADRILRDLSVDTRKVFLYTVLLGLCICFVYSAFFPAVVGSICICGLMNLVGNYKTDKLKYLNKYIIVGGGILISVAIYMTGIEGISTENNFQNFLLSILKGKLIKDILVYLGSGLVHQGMVTKIGYSTLYFLGAVVLAIYIFGIISYLKNMKEINSYFPVMLIFYTFLVGILLSYGRGEVYGEAYMTSSRYAYQSKIGLIGIVWILGCLLKRINYSKKINCVKYTLVGIVTTFIAGAMLIGLKVENEHSPYRRAIYETWIGYIQDIDQCSSDELKQIWGNDEEEIKTTVKYMKKYKLGIFYYNDDSLDL